MKKEQRLAKDLIEADIKQRLEKQIKTVAGKYGTSEKLDKKISKIAGELARKLAKQQLKAKESIAVAEPKKTAKPTAGTPPTETKAPKPEAKAARKTKKVAVAKKAR